MKNRSLTMLYQILVVLFSLMCIFMILIIMVQKGKSSTGLGGLGGGTQMLFGGSGGQDVFQKITWVLGTLFMGGSLILAKMKKPTTARYLQAIEKQAAEKSKAEVEARARAEALKKAAAQEAENVSADAQTTTQTHSATK
jgi:protein translocase SecG subunit